MKIILYMATSIDGYIAKEDDQTPWSEAEWNNFKETINEHGALIIGRKTFHLMNDDNGLEKLGNPFTVVLSTSDSESDAAIVFVKTPHEAIDVLKRRGFSSAILGGGLKANTAFFEENLVDEIIVDVEPYLFGAGVRLYTGGLPEHKLQLLGTKNIGEHTVQLQYKVQK